MLAPTFILPHEVHQPASWLEGRQSSSSVLNAIR